MEWYHVIIMFLLILIVVGFGILIACMIGGQPISFSIQRRQPNHELTQIQEEEEAKKQKKLGARVKRALHPSAVPPPPIEPVEDVKTVELKFQFGNKEKKEEQQTEIETVLLPINERITTQAELERRQKKREELRKKYNL